MVPSAATNSLLLITHPGGGKSFDYQDHWDGADLIYTGRGKVGNQQRDDARNLDVAENRRPLFVFEAAGPRRLLFRGRAVNVEGRTGRAPDDEGAMRDVLLFRLRFETTTAAPAPSATPEDASPASACGKPARSATSRQRPHPRRRSSPLIRRSSLRSASKRTKTITRSSRALNSLLHAVGCDDVSEIPGAIDLWAIRPDGSRVIFEAKTISAANELGQTRTGFAQLLEYRMEYGTPGDELCLVVDRPLRSAGRSSLTHSASPCSSGAASDFQAGNDHGSHLIDALTEPGA